MSNTWIWIRFRIFQVELDFLNTFKISIFIPIMTSIRICLILYFFTDLRSIPIMVWICYYSTFLSRDFPILLDLISTNFKILKFLTLFIYIAIKLKLITFWFIWRWGCTTFGTLIFLGDFFPKLSMTTTVRFLRKRFWRFRNLYSFSISISTFLRWIWWNVLKFPYRLTFKTFGW